MSVQQALSSAGKTDIEPNAKSAKVEDIFGAVPKEQQALLHAFTALLEDKLNKKVEKIDEKLEVMAAATDTLFGEVRKEAEITKKAQKSTDDKINKLAANVQELQKGKGKGKGGGKEQTVYAPSLVQKESEWKALVFGFADDSQWNHIEKALEELVGIANAVNVVKHHARGDRSEQGFIKFQDKDSMIIFLQKLKRLDL
jgi:hypothetical protein